MIWNLYNGNKQSTRISSLITCVSRLQEHSLQETETVVSVKGNEDGAASNQPPYCETSHGKNDDRKYPAAISGGQKKDLEKDGGRGRGQRKQRRCWSQELHRRFLNALKQLGGPYGAFLDF